MIWFDLTWTHVLLVLYVHTIYIQINIHLQYNNNTIQYSCTVCMYCTYIQYFVRFVLYELETSTYVWYEQIFTLHITNKENKNQVGIAPQRPQIIQKRQGITSALLLARTRLNPFFFFISLVCKYPKSRPKLKKSSENDPHQQPPPVHILN